MKWTQCELGDVVNFKSGGTPSKSDPELWGGDIPWVSTKELKSGRIHTTESRVTDKAIKNKKQLVDPGTVLIAVRGMVLAKAFPVSVAMRSMIFNQDIKAVIPKDGLLHDYLPYLLRGHHDELRALADEAAHGTKRIQTDRLLSFPIKLPPVPVQGCITAILSAYDDLIENNTRRIEILEEMARRLYEEWFVHFRFPGHEVVSFKESELGEIPEGWEAKSVAETFQILGGGTPSKKVPEYWEDGEINWFSPTDLTKSSSAFMEESSSKITELGLKKSSAKLFPENSVMMTSRATIGVVAINTQPASTNQGFITCLPNDEFPLYLMYHWLKDNVETFISLGTGATFKEISKGTFKEIQLAVPPVDVSRAYQEAVGPMMQQVLLLQRKNTNLRAQRDLLLPKLVSGEIDVSDIPMPDDKEVEAA